MGINTAGNFRYETPEPQPGQDYSFKADAKGAELKGVWKFDAKTLAITILQPDATVKVQRRRRGLSRFAGKWETIVDIKNGRGTAQGAINFNLQNISM